jgi:hypothetical protein
VTVLAFALYWSDFTTPVLYIFRPDLYTLPIGLQLVKQMDATNLPLLMAGSVLMLGRGRLSLPSSIGLKNLPFGEVMNVD